MYRSPTTLQIRKVAAAVSAAAALLAGVAFAAPTEAADGLPAGTLGQYMGFDQRSRFNEAEASLGTRLNHVVTMADGRSPHEMRSSVWGQFASPTAYLPELSGRLDVTVTIPLAFGQGGVYDREGPQGVRSLLSKTISGTYDADYRAVAQYLIAAGYGDAVLRLGHEFDGTWETWSARNNEQSYIDAFRHVRDVFEQESAAFRYEWTGMHGPWRWWARQAYPGDAYVDIIGLDVYYRDQGEIGDAQWNEEYRAALIEHRDFAISRGKPVSYPEWGRAFDDTPRFIDLMYNWFNSLPKTGPGSLVYQAYFNEPGLGGEYDLNNLPVVERRYVELFRNTLAGPGTSARLESSANRIPSNSTTKIHVTDDPTTTAVAVNLTATATSAPGYFTAYSCDDARPDVSNLNHGSDHTVAAAAIVPVGPSGDICVYNESATELIVDLFGRFGGAVDLTDRVPVRLHDSRKLGVRQPGETELRVRVSDPGVAAVALNVTALEPDAPGFVTVQACGQDSVDTSNINLTPGSVTPNLVIAEPDADGYVCVIPSTTTHLIVDRFASFAPDAPLHLVRPERIRDTRSDGSVRTPGRVVRFTLADTSLATGSPVTGVFINVTIVEAAAAGFATAYPCASGRPEASNVNFRTGQTIANFVSVKPDENGEVCVYSDAAADILIDVMGSAGPGFEGIVPTRLFDTRNGIGGD
jgi:hypothetical protein